MTMLRILGVAIAAGLIAGIAIGPRPRCECNLRRQLYRSCAILRADCGSLRAAHITRSES